MVKPLIIQPRSVEQEFLQPVPSPTAMQQPPLLSGNITLAADSSIGGSNNVTLSGVISGAYNLTKVGSSTYTLSGTNTYSGDTTISAGTIKLTGSVNALTDLSIASGATLDLQSTQTFATLDLDGTISRTAGSSAVNNHRCI